MSQLDAKRFHFCNTCIMLNKDRGGFPPLSPAQARVHQDSYPRHDIEPIDLTEKDFEQIEKSAFAAGEISL